MTRNEWSWQCKQFVCTDKTIQNKWICGAAARAMTMTVKQAIEKEPENLQKGAGGQKFYCAVFLYESQYPMVRDIFTAVSYLDEC